MRQASFSSSRPPRRAGRHLVRRGQAFVFQKRIRRDFAPSLRIAPIRVPLGVVPIREAGGVSQSWPSPSRSVSTRRVWGLRHKHLTHNKTDATFREFADATLGFPQENIPRNWDEFSDVGSDNLRVIKPKDFRVVR